MSLDKYTDPEQLWKANVVGQSKMIYFLGSCLPTILETHMLDLNSDDPDADYNDVKIDLESITPVDTLTCDDQYDPNNQISRKGRLILIKLSENFPKVVTIPLEPIVPMGEMPEYAGPGQEARVTGLIMCFAVFIIHYSLSGEIDGVIGGHFVTPDMAEKQDKLDLYTGELTDKGEIFVNTIKELMKHHGWTFGDNCRLSIYLNGQSWSQNQTKEGLKKKTNILEVAKTLGSKLSNTFTIKFTPYNDLEGKFHEGTQIGSEDFFDTEKVEALGRQVSISIPCGASVNKYCGEGKYSEMVDDLKSSRMFGGEERSPLPVPAGGAELRAGYAAPPPVEESKMEHEAGDYGGGPRKTLPENNYEVSKRVCLDNLVANKDAVLARIEELHQNRDQRQLLSRGLQFGQLDPQYRNHMAPVWERTQGDMMNDSILSCSYLIGINAGQFRRIPRDIKLYYYVSPDLNATMPALLFQNGREVVAWMKQKWGPIFLGDMRQLYIENWPIILGSEPNQELLKSLQGDDGRWSALYDDMVFSLILQVLSTAITDSAAERLAEAEKQAVVRRREDERLKWESLSPADRIKHILTDPNNFIKGEIPDPEIPLLDIIKNKDLSKKEIREKTGLNGRNVNRILRILAEDEALKRSTMTKGVEDLKSSRMFGDEEKDDEGPPLPPPPHLVLQRHLPFEIPVESRDDKDFVLEWIIDHNGLYLQQASARLRADQEVVETAVKNKPFALDFVDKNMENYRDVVMLAVTRHGRTLQFATEELKVDPEIVRAAIENNPYALEFVGEPLQGLLKAQPDILTRPPTKPIKRSTMTEGYEVEEDTSFW